MENQRKQFGFQPIVSDQVILCHYFVSIVILNFFQNLFVGICMGFFFTKPLWCTVDVLYLKIIFCFNSLKIKTWFRLL